MKKEILDFYRQTSPFTELGLYREFARALPDDLEELCMLQRCQIIHPVGLLNPATRMETAGFWGDLSQVPLTRLNFEEEWFPTAVSMLAELLRLDPVYSRERAARDKLHLTCRCQAILLAATLKAKGVPARVRSGFAGYIRQDGEHRDHWITEYYLEQENRWALADADIHGDPNIDFDPNDLPRSRYFTGPQAYLLLRSGELKEKQVSFASSPTTYGLPAAIRGLFYDFHCLMNQEIPFLCQPRYAAEKEYRLSGEELAELDALAELLLDPDGHFETLREIWERETKFRMLAGGLN